MPEIALNELNNWVGRETGLTDWFQIDQTRINQFADVTEDWQAIHTDPENAKETVFGGTIAHGFLTLSLLSKFTYEIAFDIEGAIAGINYGFDKIRMIAPVPSGARIRARFALKDAQIKSPTRVLLTHDISVEIEGSEKPALIAEWLTMQDLEPKN